MIDTNEEVHRIAIASFCGYKNIRYDWINGSDAIKDYMHDDGRGIPNYFYDLNAMHEVELFLKKRFGMRSMKNYHREYLIYLMEIMNPDEKLWENGTYLGSWSNAIQCALATASQKSNALIKIIKRDFPELILYENKTSASRPDNG